MQRQLEEDNETQIRAKLKFLLISIVFIVLACESNLTTQVLKQKYPVCDVIKIEDDLGEYKKVTLQCPLEIKTVRIKTK